MTPNDIEVLIYCYARPGPHPRVDAPAVQKALRSFVANGLIEPDNIRGGYRATDRGAAHIEQLCSLAWPTQVWIGADGRVIELPFGSEETNP